VGLAGCERKFGASHFQLFGKLANAVSKQNIGLSFRRGQWNVRVSNNSTSYHQIKLPWFPLRLGACISSSWIVNSVEWDSMIDDHANIERVWATLIMAVVWSMWRSYCAQTRSVYGCAWTIISGKGDLDNQTTRATQGWPMDKHDGVVTSYS